MPTPDQPQAAATPDTSIDLDRLLDQDGEAFIAAAYLALMGREPDAVGLATYLQHLACGKGKLLLAAAIFESDESRRFLAPATEEQPGTRFQLRLPRLLGMRDEEFLVGAYLLLLNRAPDAEGELSYRQHLEAGTPKIDILLALAASDEARRCRPPLPSIEAYREGRKNYTRRSTQKALQRFGLPQSLQLHEMRIAGLEERLHRLESKVVQAPAGAPPVNPDLAGSGSDQNVVAGHGGGGSPGNPASGKDALLRVTDPAYFTLSENRMRASAADAGHVKDVSRLIAFYLPQYHRIKENSAWWGPGFTEWTNVAKGRPNFDGHLQPHIPRDLGFYDLSHADIMYEQADMARQFGVGGFCFYHYWFSGRRVLEKPVNNFLASDIDFPFCICWANENWTKTWDGEENNILLKQEYKDGDDRQFIRSIEATLKDRRYIRINGAPLLLIYRIKQFPEPRKSIETWREEASRLGIPKLYVAVVDFYDISSPDEVGADAIVEFPPHKFLGPENIPDVVPSFTNPDFRGGVVEYAKVAAQAMRRQRPPYTLFRGVVPGWDNTARRQNTPHMLLNNHPELYREWLTYARWYARQTARTADEQIIFVNAWNEWGEGCHLEPDLHWGLRFLEETARTASFDASLDRLAMEEVQKLMSSRLAVASQRLSPP